MRQILRVIIHLVFIGTFTVLSAQDPSGVYPSEPPAAREEAASEAEYGPTFPGETRIEEEELPESPPPQASPADFNNPKQYIVNEVRVRGIRYLDPQVIASTSGLNKGDTIALPSDYISSAIRKMWSQQFYSDVRIVAEPVGDSVNFEIYLQERPRVFKWNYFGVRRGEESDVKEKLNLKPGTQLSDYVLTNSINILKKYYFEKGFRNVSVGVRQENDSTLRNAINVTFVVDRKERVHIGKIDFVGNEAFAGRRLRRTMKKTHQKGINFFRGTKLKETEYAEDKLNVTDFYTSHGYRNAAIVSDSIYPINEKRIGIRIAMEEGPKFYYRNVTWVGNSVYETALLNGILGVRKGAAYDRKSLHKQLGIGREMDPENPTSVSSMYQNSGYIMSSVDPSEIVVGKDSIDLEIKIYEGRQARINEVKITGNMRVDEKSIRRELYVRPGELYDRSLLMQTLRQLSQMGHFDPENMAPQINPVTNELVDVTFSLQEQSSDQVEISGGWGSGMFVGSVGVVMNNFSIRNFFKMDRWTPYPSGQNQQLAIRGQSNGTYYKALSLSFVEPWLGGKRPNSFQLGVYYSDQTNGVHMFTAGTRHFRTIGASVGIGRRLAWPDRFFSLYHEISYQAYNLKDWTGFLASNGTSNIIAFKTVFGRNTIDQPIFPRSGSDFSISLALTPPYSLFDGLNYASSDMSEKQRYRWIEYHKWLLKGEWYFPLTQNRKLVLMARAQMGYIGYYNRNKPSPFEQFEVGGDGMSGYTVYGVDIVSLRGYENGTLSSNIGSGNYANVYNRYTVELRYPFLLQPTSTIYGLIFAEAGNAFASWKAFDPFQVKRSLGAGVRIYLPYIGLVGFDWGYGFDSLPGKTERSGGHVHFMIGQKF